jgi:hypothetical protein
MRKPPRCTAGVLAGLLAVFMSGCAYYDHFDNRVGTYDVVAAQSRDAMILTNVIRASHAEPLSFVQLGQINGSGAAGATVGLPPLVLGQRVAAATSALTHAVQNETIFGANAAGGSGFVGNQANVTGSTNFTVSPSESKDFYQGLLHEVDPLILQLFIQQGVSREILFYLFTDRLIVDRDGRKTELRNDPLDAETFVKFQHFVRLAIDYGLSSEPVPGKAPGREAGSVAPSGPGKFMEPKRYQLCFNRLYWSPAAPPASNSPICGSSIVAPEEHTVSYVGREGESVKLQILPRSAFAIFQYLGRIVAAGEQGRIKLASREAIDFGPLHDDFLFVVTDGSSGPCYLAVNYEGMNYCVPAEGATNTKRILGLLVQLIALNTAIEDVPVTPTVRVVQ